MNSADFRTMMALEPHGPDTFVATGPQLSLGRALRRPDHRPGAARRAAHRRARPSSCTRCTPISSASATPPSRSGSRSTASATAAPFSPARVVARQSGRRHPQHVVVVPAAGGRRARCRPRPCRAVAAPDGLPARQLEPAHRAPLPADRHRPGSRRRLDAPGRGHRRRSGPQRLRAGLPLRRPADRRGRRAPPRSPAARHAPSAASGTPASTTPSGSTARCAPTTGTCTTSAAAGSSAAAAWPSARFSTAAAGTWRRSRRKC